MRRMVMAPMTRAETCWAKEENGESEAARAKRVTRAMRQVVTVRVAGAEERARKTFEALMTARIASSWMVTMAIRATMDLPPPNAREPVPAPVASVLMPEVKLVQAIVPVPVMASMVGLAHGLVLALLERLMEALAVLGP